MEIKKNVPHINVDYFEDLTSDISQTQPKTPEEIGVEIKKLREEKKLSLDDLSKLTGFDVATLASIENNEIQPQLGVLMKLSKALNSAFGRLISGIGDKIYSITRKNEEKILNRSATQKGKRKIYSYKSLAPEVKGRHMEALIVELEENLEQEKSVHNGEEFIYVLSGTIIFKLGDETFELSTGDSVYYLSTTPHLLAAKNGKSTILAVLYEG
ncbi:MAG: helix-turn-helix domain-containing protein [Desulfobacterales bacterium]|nr:helix-turn-helix domain-containing protein [Desulfobacterales bacterium]MBF0397565.1 helix-turn-helix domain-containing protein [Desulfobacterales bacterium]